MALQVLAMSLETRTARENWNPSSYYANKRTKVGTKRPKKKKTFGKNK